MKKLFTLFLLCLVTIVAQAQKLDLTYPAVDGPVHAVLINGGYMYIAGDFDAVGGTARHGIAKIDLSNNTLVSGWDPDVQYSGASGYVSCMSISTDGKFIFFGGQFDQVGTYTRAGFAAVLASTVAVTGWAPQVNIFEGAKFMKMSTTDTLYVLGGFDSIQSNNGIWAVRRAMAAIDTTGQVTAFDGKLGAGQNGGQFRALEISAGDSEIYVGIGNAAYDFDAVNRQGFAALDAHTGVLKPFNIELTAGGVFDIAKSGSTLYLCGSFDHVDSGATARQYIAKYNGYTLDNTFAPTSTANGPANDVRSIKLDGSYLYLEIQGNGYAGKNAYRFCKISASDATIDTSFDVGFNQTSIGAGTKLVQDISTHTFYTTGLTAGSMLCGLSFDYFTAIKYTQSTTLAKRNVVTTDFNYDFTGTNPQMESYGVDSANTGISIDVWNTFGFDLSVEKYRNAPINVSGISESNISTYRYIIKPTNGSATFDSTIIHFKVSKIVGISSPSTVKVYKRSTPGVGAFTDLGAHYNATNGDIYVTVTDFSEFVFASDVAPLPVTLINFETNYKAGNVNLSWQTASEINNKYFSVERSINGLEWEPIAHVEGHGNSQALQHYSEIDNLEGIVPNGTIYYRLKQVDFNGKYQYSNIRSVNLSNTALSVSVFPNPVNSMLNVRWVNSSNETTILRLTDLNGICVYTQNISENGLMDKQIDLRKLAKGIYVLQIISGNKVDASQSIYKN